MKIGILYICTGKYSIFWKDFYLTCEKNFITEAEKHYFVFTDSPQIEFEKDNQNVHLIYQRNLGWPNNTLKRYEIFLKSEDKIMQMDYLFYLNANLLFLEEITAEEFLPRSDQKLVGCLHPGYYNKPVKKYPYEGNHRSKAYISKKDGKYYFAGGINGGITKDFITAIKTLRDNIEQDLNNQIIAKWHDESHWNWYLNTYSGSLKILSPAYLHPEGRNITFNIKILVRDKLLMGGYTKFRGKFEPRLILSNLKMAILGILRKMK